MAEQNLNLKESLEKSKNDLPSNEEIVDTLLSGIGDVHLDESNKGIKDNTTCGTSSKTDIDNSIHVNSKTPLNVENELRLDENGEKETIPDSIDEDDFVDEEHLKDLEVDYSEDDRKKYRTEAEELKNSGNNKFKAGEYRDAAISYTNALRICPLAFNKDRAVLYANRGAAKLKLSLTESAIEDCTKAVELDAQYLKAYLRRAQLYEQTDKLDEAFADYKKILEIDPSHKEAIFACQRLPDQINERNEKLKTEMLGKLKDLGNMILKPFGLSTNNFQMVQDPNSGGYSVNFTQNPNNRS